MNYSALIGIILAMMVAITTAATSTSNWKVFLDYHAFMIVIGGTFAASLVSFSGAKLWMLTKVFFRRVLGKGQETEIAVKEIVDLAKGYRDNDKYLVENVSKIKTHFLQEAIRMICDGGLDGPEMDMVLKKRATSIFHRHEEDAEIFKSLAKFPPAFGLLGAVIGMIAMMQSLGDADSFSKVGPSLAVALVATLYGIAIANFVFLPLGENLAKVNRGDAVVRAMVIDGVKLIRVKKHPLLVEEMVLSHLLPSERKAKKPAADTKKAA